MLSQSSAPKKKDQVIIQKCLDPAFPTCPHKRTYPPCYESDASCFLCSDKTLPPFGTTSSHSSLLSVFCKEVIIYSGITSPSQHVDHLPCCWPWTFQASQATLPLAGISVVYIWCFSLGGSCVHGCFFHMARLSQILWASTRGWRAHVTSMSQSHRPLHSTQRFPWRWL